MSETDATASDLPTGLNRLPELGPDVIGTHLRPSVIRWRWIVAGLVVVISVVLLVALVPKLTNSVLDVVTLLGLVLVLAVICTDALIRAFHGAAPAISIDQEYLAVLLPFSRARVRLDAITKLTALRNDVLVEAPGAIERRGRLTKARWMPIDRATSFAVDRKELLSYLERRVEAARATMGTP